MTDTRGLLLIAEDAVLVGSVHNCAQLEVRGYLEGEVTATRALVAETGRIFGTVRAGSADVRGIVKGKVNVRDLIQIASSGTVEGDVQYGRLAMAAGGNLAASVRNVPPEVFGDLEVTVARGGQVVVQTVDLTAIDPDDKAGALQFSVTAVRKGHVALAADPAQAVTTFTQADLAAGQVLFVHDGNASASADFSVVVTDAAGATSGPARTVTVIVVDAR